MSTSPPTDHVASTGFVCDCEETARSACAGKEIYGEYEGKHYCVMHFPGTLKNVHFRSLFENKINNNDFNFRGVWFPDNLSFFAFQFDTVADFSHAVFSAPAEFELATFIEDASFHQASFLSSASFNHTIFEKTVSFDGATFGARADFSAASFTGWADFTRTEFRGNVDFIQTNFAYRAEFYSATFKDHVRFVGNEKPSGPAEIDFDLQFVRIEKPDRIAFNTLILRPNSFVNVDPRKFEFTNVEWNWGDIRKEISELKARDISSPRRMLAIACRHLAVNAEENNRYEEASRFRYMAMEARDLEHWGGFDFRRLSWWYWLASGYGERVLQAAIVLIGIFVVSAVLYTQVGFARWEPRLASESDAVTAKRDDMGAPLKLSRALTYSAAVMTFQRPEPRPATKAAQTIVLLETILGPVQAALLALAIRRKFMR